MPEGSRKQWGFKSVCVLKAHTPQVYRTVETSAEGSSKPRRLLGGCKDLRRCVAKSSPSFLQKGKSRLVAVESLPQLAQPNQNATFPLKLPH